MRSSSVLALAGSAIAANSAGTGLNDLAKAAGLKYFGTATDNPELKDAAYLAKLKDPAMWGALTVGNTQKWEYTEPANGTFDFTQADVIVDLAESQDMLVRCHTLVWYSQLPSWVSNGSWTNETLTAVMKAHIVTEMTHFKGKCYAWDVVNEALNEDGTFRENVFYKAIGQSYIPAAFGYAATADPAAKLYYNDYNIETAGAKATAAAGIVKMIKQYGHTIHGVGLQGHLTVGQVASEESYASTLQSYVAAGAEEVAYTELDIRFTKLPASAEGLAQQGNDFATVVKACLSVKQCIGVTIWDWTDKYSWIPATFPGSGEALLFDDNFNPKPAYTSVSSVLAAAATGTVPKKAAAAAAEVTSVATAAATQTTAAAAPSAETGDDSCDSEPAEESTSAVAATATAATSSTAAATASSPAETGDDSCDSEPAEESTSAAAAAATPTGSSSSGNSSSSSGVAAQYQQCGGKNFSGPTSCVSGFTCKKQNDYYYQCV
ncbi:hypothetical protein TD95_001559 [Thielaviopsis punctulata]|uniref:Beta-xylanase n=1 Tax=Thielaviopsis punctulata TaxID=72032 RepID=A0A0F4ZDR6_9PEZI|nr:hypothetical protein TD95_001559 [Thielaviopsis punctulata]